MSIHNGDTVRVHYTGTLADGTAFDSSVGGEPLEFVMGNGNLIPAFEAAVLGREEGDTVQVSILAAEAYGEVQEELIFDVPRDRLPEQLAFEPGLALQLTTEEGEVDVKVLAVTEDSLTLDANHPLAGENLTFTIEVVSVGAGTQ